MSVPVDAAARRKYVKEVLIPREDLRPYINGKFVSPHSDQIWDVTDPMTGGVLTTMPAADGKDIAQAVTAAYTAFHEGPWRRMHPRGRAARLLKLASLIEDELESLALLESADVGKRIAGVRAWDIPNAAEVYRYYAGWADKVQGLTLPDVGNVRINTYREPVGVCAAIMPWNFPFPCLAWKLAPALAVGCTVVVKSAERAPLSAQALARLCREADIPSGVVNVVMGEGSVAGAALVRDPRIDKISFTGGLSTARDVIAGSSSNLARLSLELGGKNPNVVLADADIEAAAAAAAGGMFGVAGQDCGAGSRVLVQNSILDQFSDLLLQHVTGRVLGDPLDDATEQGPQIDDRHLQRIDSYVRGAVNDGAVPLAGGGPDSIGPLFYTPTVLSKVTPQMTISREEVFGPVGALYGFDSLNDAIRLANDTFYGLACSVWTSNTNDSETFVREIRAGTCWVNCYGYFDTTSPWGGFKSSGYGRELGKDGIEGYLETKAVFRAP
jgi:aldehyde dehydrogenase (NAD+)